MSTATEISEYRVGRNFIRVHDRVHVRKGWCGKKNGFDTKVSRILANPDGTPNTVEVIDPRNGGTRSLRPEFIERKTQEKQGQRIEVRLPAAVKPGPHKAGRR